ncbi:MAG TPA: hypothetical protein VIO61_02495 [Anaerolineaceae bacterium]
MYSPEVETPGSFRPAGMLFSKMGLVVLIFFMLACSTINIGVKITQAPTLRTSPIKQLIIGPEGGEISIPQGVKVVIPVGALADDVDVNISQVLDGVQIPGGLQVLGPAYGISISDPNRLNGTVDILLPLSLPVDPSRGQVVVYKLDGKEWTDIGGSVEGKSIRASVKTFSIFVPAQTPFPHRPIGFINSGQWHAVVMPATWVIDPNYAKIPWAFPITSTISFGMTAPVWPNPSRYLLLPLGTYTFCYEWTDRQDKNKDGYTDWYHEYTPKSYMLKISSPEMPAMAEDVPITTNIQFPKSGRCPGAPRLPTQTWIPPTRFIRSETATITLTVHHSMTPGNTRTSTNTLLPSKTPTMTRVTTIPVKTQTFTPLPTFDYMSRRRWFIGECNAIAEDCRKRYCDQVHNLSGCRLECPYLEGPIENWIDPYWFNLAKIHEKCNLDALNAYLAGYRACVNAFLGDQTANQMKTRDACWKAWVENARSKMTSCLQMTCEDHCNAQGKSGSLKGPVTHCECR